MEDTLKGLKSYPRCGHAVIMGRIDQHWQDTVYEIKSPSRRRTVAVARAVVSIVAIDNMGISGADVAKWLNLTPSAVSILVSRARRDPDLKKDFCNILNLL
jgi:hypothetical protein